MRRGGGCFRRKAGADQRSCLWSRGQKGRSTGAERSGRAQKTMMFKMRTWGGGDTQWLGEKRRRCQSEAERGSTRGKRRRRRHAEGARQAGQKRSQSNGGRGNSRRDAGDYREGGGGPRNPGCGEAKGSTSVEGRGTGGPVRGLQGGAA